MGEFREVENVSLIIVEDDLVSSYAMSLMLKEYGIVILENLISADTIMEDFEKHQPDMVLMDIRLNGDIDGTEAAIQLREKHHCPIIFISAFNDEETKSKVQSISNSSLINKPYEITQIVSAISHFVQ